MPENPLFIKTIVSSAMAEPVAKAYGVEVQNVLTGFKFIGEQIGFLEKVGMKKSFIFGFEESCGYLAGTYVRDKDGVVAAMLLCEAAAYYKAMGKTLVDRLTELYDQYGYYINDLMEFEFPGAVGMKKMTELLTALREEAPSEIAGKKVIQIADYLLSKRRIVPEENGCVLSPETLPISLPKSDVLEYVLEGDSNVIIRPSGTEPKLKVYLSAKGETKTAGLEIIEAIKRDLDALLRP
jgi:phosphoglucomutase